MLRYLQWLAIAGVWLPLAVVGLLFGMAWVASQASTSVASSGWVLAVGGMLLVVAAAHAMAVSSLVGLGLLASRRAPRIAATVVSSLVGGAIAILVLGRIYLGLGA